MAIGVMTTGDRLRRLRVLAGVSQTEMAQAGDITQPSYAGYESDRARIPATKMTPFARKLGLRLDAFAHGLGLDDSEEAEQEFRRWLNATLERRYTLDTAGLVRNPVYPSSRTDLYENENDLKMNSDRPQPPLTLWKPFATPAAMAF